MQSTGRRRGGSNPARFHGWSGSHLTGRGRPRSHTETPWAPARERRAGKQGLPHWESAILMPFSASCCCSATIWFATEGRGETRKHLGFQPKAKSREEGTAPLGGRRECHNS